MHNNLMQHESAWCCSYTTLGLHKYPPPRSAQGSDDRHIWLFSDLCTPSLGLPSDLPAWDCLRLSVHNTPGTVYFYWKLVIRNVISGAGPPSDQNLLKLVACSCMTFWSLKNSLLFDRPFGPHFSDFEPISDPKMASPDRLRALFFRLPTSISEFSKKLQPSQAKSLFLLVRRLRKSLFFSFKIV